MLCQNDDGDDDGDTDKDDDDDDDKDDDEDDDDINDEAGGGRDKWIWLAQYSLHTWSQCISTPMDCISNVPRDCCWWWLKTGLLHAYLIFVIFLHGHYFWLKFSPHNSA